jgi:putative ABC transport system permease protein
VLRDWIIRLRSLLRRRRVEQELDEELTFHLERQFEKHLKAGLEKEEATKRVRLQFGGSEQVKEECRRARGVQPFENLLQDLRYGTRVLRKAPGFTVTALLTLALGIGASTALFSAVYGVLLRPLPFSDASRLVVMNETTPKVGRVAVSFPNFLDWKAQARSFSAIAAVTGVGFDLTGIDRPRTISGQAVTANFLSMLGVHPLVGRDFTPNEDQPGTAPVVLLSYALWQSEFGAKTDVVGRTLSLDGHGYTVIGVLPPQFRWMEKAEVLETMGAWASNNPGYRERGERGDTAVIGRLKPHVELRQARAQMEGIAARLAHLYPEANDQFGVALRPIRDVFVGDIRPAVLVLFAAAAFVLLIACANVGNLFVMRGIGRARELSLRMAVGASAGRIIAQMIAESFLITTVGGLAGLAVAAAAIAGLVKLIPADLLAGATVSLNGPALFFAIGLVAVCAFVFGLAPAMQARRRDVQSELQERGRSTSAGACSTHGREFLVTGEVALALILLIGAGLMTKSLTRLLRVDAGIRTDHVLTMQIGLREAQYNRDPVILNFWSQLLGRVSSLPGIATTALGTNVPLTNDHWRDDITIEGMSLPKPGSFPHPDMHVVSSGYVKTLGIDLLKGRSFTEADNEHAPAVAMINSRLAQQYFGRSGAVGKRIMLGHLSAERVPKWIRIVGVLHDTKLYGLANPSRLEVYLPLRQHVTGSMTLAVRSTRDPSAVASDIRSIVSSIDRDQPITESATMHQLLEDSIWSQRTTFTLLGFFSAIAVLLAAVGIYGVISYSVAQRTQEIGIRVALGAQRLDVLQMLLAQGGRLSIAGLVIGLFVGAGLTRLMSKLLYSVSTLDPATFGLMTITVALVALLACYIPARRSLHIEPMTALRCE